jgi:hypothetical protein
LIFAHQAREQVLEKQGDPMLRRVVPALLAGAAVVTVAAPAVAATPATGPTFQVLGELPIPGSLTFSGATFGGLSGVDYDAGTGTWRVISNDGSNHGPARFYFLNLGNSGSALQAAVSSNAGTASSSSVTGGLVPLLRADGTTYPPSASAGQDTVEPEAIRFDPTTKDVFWANEGVNNGTLAVPPSIRESTTDGHFVKQFPVARQVANGSATSGIRDGEGLTGITVATNGVVSYSTLAGPLLQDGPNPTATTGAFTRILGQSRALGWPVLSEYAYPLDKLPLTDANGNGTNQVADILTVDATHYLVLERGTAPGKGNSVRLYEIDTTGAFNVVSFPTLGGATFTPVTKTLLLDFASLNLPCGVANFSGLTWGPTLANGDRSLVLVSDNGFDANTPTRILALDAHGI